MPVRLKVGPIQTLSEARYINALDAETWLTFSFDPLNAAGVPVDKALEMIQWLYEPAIVAEFGSTLDEKEIKYIIEKTGIKALEFSADHILNSVWTGLTQFVRHTIHDIDKIPEIEQWDNAYHIIDLNSNQVTLNAIFQHRNYLDWKNLFRKEHVFTRAIPEDYSISNQLHWIPYGWDIQLPFSDVTELLLDT